MNANKYVNKLLKNLNTLSLNPIKCLATAATGQKTQPKKTCLYDFHLSHNGKIVDFAGWLMPVQYKDLSIQESHIHTRNKCSIFDVSHMMQTKVYGKDRYKYIESLIVSDIAGLKSDLGTLTVFTNSNGGIIDDLIVSNTSNNYLYIVSNAGCADKDFAHLKQTEQEFKSKGMDVTLEKIEDRGLLALQGPLMHQILQECVKFDLKKFPFMNTTESKVFDIENCRITRCGYTGEDGVEISVPINRTAELAERLLALQNGQVCKLAGLGARDTLRLEAGLCLYGNDIDDTTTPVEAGLAWTIHKRRRLERNFPGADIILNQLKEKPKKRRVGLKLLSNAGPSARQHMKIFDLNGESEIGEITSGCQSPLLKQNISMGYVSTNLAQPGTRVLVDIRKKKYEAEVVKLPFVPTNYYQI
ncbi:unnamed protein product [Brachionus calyciflorus]|uniref:Aminomethyltransferase n=1 Tax=Brachionus calyciflorus TaxID=104777 RepID=A0A813M464_9BILA|nr:unnamed protein product [Brachionus calyciflorus]